MDLKEIRLQIDSVDERLTELLVQRMKAVAAVAESKRESGKPIRDPAREQTVLDRAAARADEPCAPYIRALYRRLLELSCDYQAVLLGENTSRSEASLACEGANRLAFRCDLPRSAGACRDLMQPLLQAGLEPVSIECRPLPGQEEMQRWYFVWAGEVLLAEHWHLIEKAAAHTEHFVFLGAYKEPLWNTD